MMSSSESRALLGAIVLGALAMAAWAVHNTWDREPPRRTCGDEVRRMADMGVEATCQDAGNGTLVVYWRSGR